MELKNSWRESHLHLSPEYSITNITFTNQACLAQRQLVVYQSHPQLCQQRSVSAPH